jgi:serine/threonine protein kinase
MFVDSDGNYTAESQTHGKAVDFWSLGFLAYYLVTGEHAFQRSDSRLGQVQVEKVFLWARGTYRADTTRLSAELNDLLRKLFHPLPAERVSGFIPNGQKLGEGKSGLEFVLKHEWFNLCREYTDPVSPPEFMTATGGKRKGSWFQESATHTDKRPYQGWKGKGHQAVVDPEWNK